MDYQYTDNYARQRKAENLVTAPEQAMDEHAHTAAQSDSKEYKKFAALVGVIALCATIMTFVLGFDIQEWMRWFMSGTFVILGSFKLIGYEDFIIAFPSYDVIAKRFKPYNYLYPFIELFLGFLFAADLLPVFRNVVALFIAAVGAYGIMKTLHRGDVIRCACLGNVIKLPLSTVSLWEDIAMAFMAVIMLITHFVLK